ncbi:gliding motility-associated C-terminal domain-containing protein [Flavobacterium flevense]|uniref:Ig-like domain-containing protein n=2 Tax=Flavobacterium flevense TaxID=983 RepID=A0A4Y4AXA4_9FLAO|nr:hypothetical protein FFL01_14580 [Flavobacterium flevense]SHL82067.1 gliding motility-associated C-terminal domain-containing protein [Flavobacterium flevense]
MKMRLNYFILLILIGISSIAQNKNNSIGFKENKGQITDQNGKPNNAVKFLLNTNGLNVQLKQNGFSYDIYETKKIPVKHRIEENNSISSIAKNDKKVPDYNLEYTFHRIDIDFVNSNPHVELISNEESKDYDNYYNVPDKPEGIVNVHQYQQITYKNIYPNIDVVFSIPKDSSKAVEYNFVVHPNGKISDIQLKFNGAKTELVDNKIKMQVRFGEMEEILPASWTEDGMTKKSIHVGYKKIKKNVYGFNTSNSVNGKTLIIDPVPVRLWGTYYGGEKGDYSTDICNDSYNNVYISGYTWSTSNIATTGNFIDYYYAPFYGDGFITKFNTDGIRLWGIYYAAIPETIKVDTNGNLYFTGGVDVGPNINNSLVATNNSHQPLSAGNYKNAYLVKLNPLGTREWGTFYGGDLMDIGYDICFDKQNNIYLVGFAMSSNNIATAGSHQPIHADDYYGDDGFIAKFTPQGQRIWGTYFGGKRDEQILSSNISDDDYLYITGTTSSDEAISTNNTKTGYNAGMIAKFNLDGQRIWGSYFNGTTSCTINKSTLKGNYLYISGITNSHNNLNSTNTFNENFMDLPMNFGFSSYIVKFDINLQNQVWGTYFGEIIQDIAINSKNKLIFEGVTSMTNGIATANAYSTSPQYGDAYMIKLDEDGKREWGTYYGGNGSEGLNGASDVNNKISIDNLDNIYLVGNTQSTSGISTPNVHQENYSLSPSGGLQDVYLAKFQDCLSNPITSSNSPICIGNNLELKASGGTNYLWTGPNSFTSTEQNPIIINATAQNSGQYSCLITGTGGCDDTKTVDVIVGDVEAPVPDLTTLPTITGDCNTTVANGPTATDACAGVINGTTTNPLSYNLPGTYTIVWNYNDGNGNNATQNQTITITSQALPTVTSPQTFCFKQNATITDITIAGQNIKWYDALTNGNLLSTTTLLQNNTTYYASQTLNGCESERVAVLITIQNTSMPTATANQSFCSDSNPTIANIQITGNQIKWYDALNNGSLLSETTSLVDGVTYYVSQTANNCESERLGVSVSIVNTPSAPTANGNQFFCKNENATLADIQITGQNIKWYDANFAAAVLPNTTLLEDNKTYYASQTIGCESDRIPILIRVYNTPLPTANKNQQFCIAENATIAHLSITGSNIKWYQDAANGTVLAETTWLENNKTYFATQTANNCESERLAITVKIQDTQIPIANSPQIFCIQENAKISDIVITGQNVNWFESASSSINISESTLLENGITYYASETINNCESERIPVAINILEATTGDCINFVDELPYPKFFTPNNDGYNDTWTIDFAYLKPNTGIQIYDRYGKLLKVLLPNSAWNGQFNSQELPATDYWFVVTRANGQEYKSHFSLKR